ncbi:MAG: penicillin acylase family protein [Ferruginibacter sp.]
MKLCILFLLLPFTGICQANNKAEIIRWELQAKQVTVIRDNWGIPHIYGKTDADAVFGLLYAQCEDDFKRVEMNYIEKLGRLAEVKGEKELFNDLLIRLIIDSADAVEDYKKSPAWLQKLMNAYADGINYYLYKNPSVKPLLLHRFKPWYPLLWTDGSIGAISTGGATATDVKNFYSGANDAATIIQKEEKTTGSNGFAFAPSITSSGKSILYINPHVTFYFRPEVHMVSEEGLNVYGAVTWGQFFIYQGFNEKCGWMHTSSNVDVADLYAEKIIKSKGRWYYNYDGKQRPVTSKRISLQYYKNTNTALLTKDITAFSTHHGPVLGEKDGQWLALKASNRSLNGLIQSWQRIKARGFSDYKKTMDLKSNTSNNTVYADAEGNIAYWHGNFIPRRDVKYNWAGAVDGSTSATEWKGLHKTEETIHLYNPPNGWLQNCNSTPFTVAGINNPKKENYPLYMAPDAENFRGINAVRVLSREKSYNLDKVIAAGYDTYMTAFVKLVPALVKAFEEKKEGYENLKKPVQLLKEWDMHASVNSIATTLAVEWATLLMPKMVPGGDEDEYHYVNQVSRTANFVNTASPDDLLKPLDSVIIKLTERFGTWEVKWGDVNRFQRISSDIDQKYNDASPSIPVAFASAIWGMLPSYSASYFPGTKKRYGVNGNSFICAVEFGDKIKAKSLLAGGQSGNPGSKHFTDQANMYSKGQFKDVLFYKEDVLKNIEKQYHPGE